MSLEDNGEATRDISAIMRRVRSVGTVPERAFQAALEARGLSFTATASELPGKPDFTLPERRVAVFIDGDFWHGNQWTKRKLTQLEDQFQRASNRAYWLKKIRRNMQRDCSTTAVLLSMGWTVVRFWESQIRENVEGCANVIADLVEHGATPSLQSLLPRRTVAEYFAGIGLMRMGLERQGWVVAFSNDIDPRKQSMYTAHFRDEHSHFVLGDIHDLAPDVIPSVTLATASFPCTDLSLAGSRNGIHGTQSSAFWGFTRILDGLNVRRPPLVLIENVPSFLTSHNGKDFLAAMLELNRLGYSVDAFILDAARFVPQSRQRLFVVGMHDDLYAPETLPLHLPALLMSDTRPSSLATYMLKHQAEIRWRIRPLPSMPESSGDLRTILEDLPHDHEAWWSRSRAEKLLNQMSPRHRELAESMITGSEWSYGTAFRRMRVDRDTGESRSMAELRVDGIAGCLRTPKGGSAKQILFKAGKGEYHVRLIQPIEAARLMGADGYVQPESLDQALFGFGDAVVVPVVEWVAEHYLNPVVNELVRGRPIAPLSQEAAS